MIILYAKESIRLKKVKQYPYLTTNKKSANRERSLYLIITKVTNSHYTERHYYCMSKYEISEWI
ncbi:hypothetical protein COK91_19675 [Bacillus cereus]|nr:hypothetical protein CN440_02145 [Bacillus cereus]PFU80099.1 hypothetical protein COK91_19675 [Bacillus cereus]PFV97179.1 hypothetical protein COL21_12710 [Bacillus thuringiensis]